MLWLSKIHLLFSDSPHLPSPYSRQKRKAQAHSKFQQRSNSSLDCSLHHLTLPDISNHSLIVNFIYHSPVRAVLEVSNNFSLPKTNIFYYSSCSASTWVLPEEDLVADLSLGT